MKAAIKDDSQNLLHFIVQKTRFCLLLDNILKVTPLLYIEPIPDSPNYFVGLMNLSGESIVVIDLALSLGLKRSKKYTVDTPILLCRNTKRKIGIVVDKVIDIFEANKNNYQMSDELNKGNSPYLATVVLDDNLSMLLNIDRIIRLCYLNNFNKIGDKS